MCKTECKLERWRHTLSLSETDLHFVGIPSDSQGLVCSSGHGVILNHYHLHSCSLLQLFDGLSSFADDQADFVGGDKDLLDRTVAVHLTVEAWPIPTLLHNLSQQPLGLLNVLWAPSQCAGPVQHASTV